MITEEDKNVQQEELYKIVIAEEDLMKKRAWMCGLLRATDDFDTARM